jgi:NDP-sugar pyrophosphorylase family protein
MQGVFGTQLRGMVLCAGMSSRLKDLGEELPKPLLPVCNHPLASYALSLLRGFGITEIGINLFATRKRPSFWAPAAASCAWPTF